MSPSTPLGGARPSFTHQTVAGGDPCVSRPNGANHVGSSVQKPDGMSQACLPGLRRVRVTSRAFGICQSRIHGRRSARQLDRHVSERREETAAGLAKRRTSRFGSAVLGAAETAAASERPPWHRQCEAPFDGRSSCPTRPCVAASDCEIVARIARAPVVS